MLTTFGENMLMTTLLGYFLVLSLIANVVLYCCLVVAVKQIPEHDSALRSDNEYLCCIYRKDTGLIYYAEVIDADNPGNAEIMAYMHADISSEELRHYRIEIDEL